MDQHETQLHDDGTITIWSQAQRRWARRIHPMNATESLRGVSTDERERIMRHTDTCAARTISREELRALREDAERREDAVAIAVCDRALAGEGEARIACAAAIRAGWRHLRIAAGLRPGG